MLNKNTYPANTLLQSLFLAVITLLMLIPNIKAPFWGHHEFNGVFYGTIAKNYLQYGLVNTKGAQITNGHLVEPSLWQFHTHHPATYPLLISFAYRFIGSNEFVSRSLSIIASIFGIILLNKLIYLLFPQGKYLWIAPLVIIFTPLFRYYARLPVFEPLLFPLVMLGLIQYFHHNKTKRNQPLKFTCITACLLDWPGYWLPIWILLIELVTNKRRKIILAAISSIIISTLIIFVAQYIAYGGLTELINVFTYRIGTSNQPFTYMQWFRLLISRTKAFMGLPVIISSLLGSYFIIKNKKVISALLISIGIGISHIILFRHITWYHDYMLYHTLPFIGISTAGFAYHIQKRLKPAAFKLLSVALIAITLLTTNKFYHDLADMKPHQDCVEMGMKVSNSQETQTFSLNQEKSAECPVFINYYGDKPYTINRLP